MFDEKQNCKMLRWTVHFVDGAKGGKRLVVFEGDRSEIDGLV